ncbi:efflux RND transporter permease subunit, partial [Escherichia coli]|nr:efflux RND transporter permease subunit [Escherichia coli]
MKGGFNLSDWALRHQSLVWYLMAVSLVMGVFSYLNLGREEDPSFAIKTMVIQTRWPGATVDDTLEQVTDRIEKKLEELDSLDYVKSYTRPGESTVFVYLKDTTKAGDIPDIWYQVRKKISDIQG